MRPGSRLRKWALQWLDATTVERLVDPILADLQCEYQSAIVSGHRWRARRVLVLSYVGFWKAILINVLSPSNSSRTRTIRATVLVSALAFALTTALFVLPPLLRGAWPADPLAYALLLVPQALPLSVPIGLAVGVLYAMRGRRPRRDDVFSVLAISSIGVAFALISVQWLVPNANQAFRETVAAAVSPGTRVHIEPGLNELGLSRLSARTDDAGRSHFQILLAVCMAPVSFGLLALGLSAFVRTAPVAVALAVAVPLAYWEVMFVTMERRPVTWYAIVLAPWLPNLAFLTISLIFLRLARARA